MKYEYLQLTNKYCEGNSEGHFANLESAKLACDGDNDCVATEDIGCDNVDFGICKKGTTFAKSSYGACIYLKKVN